ncbi:MAG: phospholipid carrier-dependent glycosyltransferase, partial [Planctomycetota bacterium]
MKPLKANPDALDVEARRTMWRRLGAFVAMFPVCWGYQSPIPTDWDAWDYSAQAIQGHSSDLLLGRWYHIAVMRGAYLVGSIQGQISLLDAYTVMQSVNMALMAGAVAVGMAWTRRLTGSAAAEVVFALLFLTGPMFGIYGSSIMTEPLALLTIALGFWAWQRGIQAERRNALWALLAGALLGVAINIREPALLLAAWPVVSVFAQKPRNRWAMLAAAAGGALATLGFGVLMAWAWYPVGYTGRTYWQNIAGWTASMSEERQQFAIQPPRQLLLVAQFALAAAPVAAVLALPAGIWAARKRTPTAWLAVGSLPYLLIVLVNHDLAVNPRFIMPWLWVLGPVVAHAVAAVCVERGRNVARNLLITMAVILGLGLGTLAVGWSQLQRYHFGYVRQMARAYEALWNIRSDAVIIAGPATPIAYHFNRLEIKDFRVIGSTWDWPRAAEDQTPAEALAERIEEARNQRRPLWVNMDAKMWALVNRESGEFETVQQVAEQFLQVQRKGYWPMVLWIGLSDSQLPGDNDPQDTEGPSLVAPSD